MLSFSEFKNNYIEKWIKKRSIFLFSILLILALLRLILSLRIGNYFDCTQFYDDALLMNYTDLSDHFQSPNIWSLVKYMGYPVYINILHFLHINYTLGLALTWIISSLLVFRMAELYFKNSIISITSYTYVLFLPTAFEMVTSARMYRNSIILPFVIIVFSIMLIDIYHAYNNDEKWYVKFFRKFILGFVFLLTYYIKEDGLWILCCMLFFSIIELIGVIIKNRKVIQNLLIYALCICLPFAIFLCGTNVYKSINYKYFGVSYLETRNGGEIGKFVANVYKIKSENRTSVVWAPADAIEKAFDVSPTLQSVEGLENDILHSDWYQQDIYTNPIQGDFLTWVLRTSLNKLGVWESEKQINDLFKKANSEIESSFENGTLEKDNRIQLLSSTGGYTFSEILDLKKLVKASLYNHIEINMYIPGAQLGKTDDAEMCDFASKITGISYFKDYDERNSDDLNKTNDLIQRIFSIYRVVNFLLVAICVLNILFILFRLVIYKRMKVKILKYMKNDLINLFFIFVLSGITICYAFAISWFSYFLFYKEVTIWLNFYTIAIPGFLSFLFIFSIGNLSIFFRKKVRK